MSASIRSADQATHIKIVGISLLAATVVVAIGIGSRNFGIAVDPAVTKTGKLVNFTIKDIPTVR